MNSKSSRRQFVGLAGAGMGGLAFSPFIQTSKKNIVDGQPEKATLTVVCLGAHPGDPEFGCGGTLARYGEAGHRVVIIYLTRGEAGDPSKTFEQSAALRTAEAETACRILNAKAVFAGQTDAHTELNKTRTEEMNALILAEKPDLVFTQWPVDTHPDHQVCGLLALNAWTKSNKAFDLYYYEVNTGSETLAFEPTDYVDISLVRQKKKTALLAHKTQDPEKVYNDFFAAMEDFRGLEAGVKCAEAFVHFKTKTQRAQLPGL